jgi:hypothetical protein
MSSPCTPNARHRSVRSRGRDRDRPVRFSIRRSRWCTVYATMTPGPSNCGAEAIRRRLLRHLVALMRQTCVCGVATYVEGNLVEPIARCWITHREAALVVTDSIDMRSSQIPSSKESEGVRAGSCS